MAAWIGFLCLLMVAGAAGDHDPRGFLLVLVWLPWLVPVMLTARAQVTAAGDTLTYRGPFRTRSWHRSQVRCFEVAPVRWSRRASQVQMHTADGQRVAFAVTRAYWPWSTARLQRWRTALEDWRAGTSARSPA